jgi:hypothetical protein
MSDKQFTWADLKDFCNSLSPEQLNNKVMFWGEDTSGPVLGTEELKEDYVLTDYGYEPAAVQEYEEDDEPYDIALPKGTPIINVD